MSHTWEGKESQWPAVTNTAAAQLWSPTAKACPVDKPWHHRATSWAAHGHSWKPMPRCPYQVVPRNLPEGCHITRATRMLCPSMSATGSSLKHRTNRWPLARPLPTHCDGSKSSADEIKPGRKIRAEANDSESCLWVTLTKL